MKATLKSVGMAALTIALQALLQALLQHAGVSPAIAGPASIGTTGVGAYLVTSPLRQP